MFHCLYLHPHDCRPGYLPHYTSPPREWCSPLPHACPWGRDHTLLPVVNILSPEGKMPALWVWSVQQGFGRDISCVEVWGLSSLIEDWGRVGCAVLGVMFWNAGMGWQECRSSKLCKEFRACWRRALWRFFLDIKTAMLSVSRKGDWKC